MSGLGITLPSGYEGWQWGGRGRAAANAIRTE